MGQIVAFPDHAVAPSRAAPGAAPSDKSDMDSGISISRAQTSSAMCQRPGIKPRFSHCSTALGVKAKRLATTSLPPNDETRSATSFMVTHTGTGSSDKQELCVPVSTNGNFQRSDTAGSHLHNPAMNGFMDNDGRGAEAFRRFAELLNDLALGDEAAMNFAYEIAGKPGNLGEKAVRQWFSRKTLPPYAIFNIAEALGVDVAWLGGSDRIPKERAIHKGGAYQREMERVEQIRANFAARKPRKSG